MAASFQQAVVDVLVAQGPQGGGRRRGRKGLVLGGGVAANSLLRTQLLDACERDGLRCLLPSPAMCTDNAAMIAATGWYRLRSDGPTSLDAGAVPNLHLPLSICCEPAACPCHPVPWPPGAAHRSASAR